MMGSQKPYLLVRSFNNLGAETRVMYAPSTAFYLADREAGRPWATRLPFPVQVVVSVETLDWVSRNRFVTRSAYHHGYFDGIEREFRGFGMVEQHDTVELGVLTQTGASRMPPISTLRSYVPPVVPRHGTTPEPTPWAARDADLRCRVLQRAGPHRRAIPGHVVAGFLAPRRPHRQRDPRGDPVLKGGILRQEVYACDGTAAAALPYSVSERNYTVSMFQPFGPNRHAVFYTHNRESVDFHYERELYSVGGQTLADPRSPTASLSRSTTTATNCNRLRFPTAAATPTPTRSSRRAIRRSKARFWRRIHRALIPTQSSSPTRIERRSRPRQSLTSWSRLRPAQRSRM